MAGKKRFGTNVLTGLDVSRGAHLISDGSLAVSTNGWTDKEGEVSVARGHEALYGGFSAISCFAAGRIDGVDTLVWMDGDNVYVNNTNVGTISAGSSMQVKDFDDKFFFMGASDGKNYIWDGDVLRQHGPWQITEWSRGSLGTYIREDSDQFSVTGITNDDPGVITTSTSHTVAAGESFYIENVTGMTELNGRILTAASATSTTITLSEDTSDYGTYSPGGTVTTFGCGISGEYSYYIVPTVKIVASSKVIEGKPRGLVFGANSATYGSDDSTAAESVTLSVTDEVKIKFSVTPDYDCSGTVDVDYLIGVRLYRTKSGGSDIYLEHEWWSNDSDGVNESSGTYTFFSELGGFTDPPFRSKTQDVDLGAVYLYGLNDLGTPPQSSVMALVGQRLFMNDVDNPERVYFTHLAGVDYVPTLNYLTIPDDVTMLGAAGTMAVVASVDRLWRISLLGGIPDMDEIESDVGADSGTPTTTTSNGLLFLRSDGAWLTTGAAPPIKVTRQAFASITGPSSLASYGDILYIGGTGVAYVNIRRAGGTYWHEFLGGETYVDATNGTFYAASSTQVFKLFEGDYLDATIQTKDFILYTPGDDMPVQELQSTRVVIDFSGDDEPTVLVNGNRESDYDVHLDEGTDQGISRRLLLYSIPRLHNHVVSVTIGMSGNATLHGVWLEAE